MSLLEVRGLTKHFRVRDASRRHGSALRRAIHDVSLSVQAGEIVGLFGLSAAGKTTTLRIIAGKLSPDAGEIYVNRENVTAYSPRQRERLRIRHFDADAMLHRPWWKLSYPTVESTLRQTLRSMGVFPSLGRRLTTDDIQQRVDCASREFNLAHVLGSRVVSLASSERLRLELLRCLIGDPLLLILDEPLSRLDNFRIDFFVHELQRLKSLGSGILLTDQRPEARELVDRAVFIRDGEVQVEDPTRAPSLVPSNSTPQLAATASQPVTLHAVGLIKDYGRRRVVTGVDLSVSTGEIVALLGPNGAGKTTTSRMMMGAVRPTSGRVFLNDRDVTFTRMHQRARLGMGYLPQESTVFRRMSVAQNLGAILEYQPLSNGQRRQRVDELLERFGLRHVRRHLAVTLSGGERRRLEIARSIASNPPIIILDEPFVGIDPVTVQGIQDVLRELRDGGFGILLTDHRQHETLSITDRNYILFDGQVIAQGTAEEILRAPAVQRYYLGERLDAEALLNEFSHERATAGRGHGQQPSPPAPQSSTAQADHVVVGTAESDTDARYSARRDAQEQFAVRGGTGTSSGQGDSGRGGSGQGGSGQGGSGGTGATPAASRSGNGDSNDASVHSLTPQSLDDCVFRVFQPRAVRPEVWYPLPAFMHQATSRPGEPDPVDEVRRQARELLGGADYRDWAHEILPGVARGSRMTFIPELPGCEVVPNLRTFTWQGFVHGEVFQLRCAALPVDPILRGQMLVLCAGVILAAVPLEVPVSVRAHAPHDLQYAASQQYARPYRKIFVSYSHADEPVVKLLETAALALGDRYLRDRTDLRAGEHWDPELLRLIEAADVFQLFWSNRSMRSPHVRREWEHALSLQRPHFVRPVVWEDPFPKAESEDLPPSALKRLHFQRIQLPSQFGHDDQSAPAATRQLDATRSNPSGSTAPDAESRFRARRGHVPSTGEAASALTSYVRSESSQHFPVTARHHVPADVRLHIQYDPQQQRLIFRLNHGQMLTPLEESGQLLRRPVSTIAAHTIDFINSFARGPGPGQRHVARHLQDIGIGLWRELLPDSIQRFLIEHSGEISSLLLVSRDDPIPWELLHYPASVPDASFLVERMQVSRWTPDVPVRNEFALSPLHVVVARDPNDEAELEADALSALFAARGATVANKIQDSDALLDLLDHSPPGNLGALHFACHNVLRRESLLASEIQIGAGTFSPHSLHRYAGTFAPSAPLVFMNACATDAKSASYTRLSSWADGFLEAGAGVFAGTLWEVRDESARHFAVEFYQALFATRHLGQAFHRARMAIRDSPGDPTWLAYTLYGNVDAQFAAPPSPEPRT